MQFDELSGKNELIWKDLDFIFFLHRLEKNPSYEILILESI